VFVVGAAAIFFMPQHCILCCDDVFCAMVHAAAKLFVPQQSYSCLGKVSCCSKPLHAAASLFMLWQTSLCHGNRMTCCGIALHCSLCRSSCRSKKQCAAALHGIPRHHFFVPWQKMTCCCIPWHVLLCRGIVLCAAAMFLVAWSYFLCHVKKRCAKAFRTVVLHSVARNDVLLHSVALHIMLRHGVLCHGIVCCAAAMLPQGEKNQPVWRSSKDFFGGRKQSTCVVLAAITASWSFWPWWL